MTDLLQAIRNLQGFTVPSLTRRIASLESALVDADTNSCSDILARESVSNELLTSAYLLKRTSSQIDTMVHALGILLTLPHILEPSERIEYLSLGAGNTGRAFDLETTQRIAEFKFIYWQGGSETIRQNGLFKDFFLLAEHQTQKRKFIYVLGKKHPLKFLGGRRSLASVMSRNNRLWAEFQDKYANQFTTVGEYYSHKHNDVRIEDVGAVIGGMFAPEDALIPDNET
jgi:hypothetical protein